MIRPQYLFPRGETGIDPESETVTQDWSERQMEEIPGLILSTNVGPGLCLLQLLGARAKSSALGQTACASFGRGDWGHYGP